MTRLILSYLAALITGAVIVSIANTHIVLEGLVGIGANIPTPVRIEAIQRDLVGFGPTLLALLAIGFAIAFPVAGLIARLLGEGWRRIGYALAGATAVFTLINAITIYYNAVLGSTITPVASGRDVTGLLVLSIGGAAAGLLFAVLKPARHLDQGYQRQ